MLAEGVCVRLQIGSIVDRYTVEAELGRGGMATVYRVRHNGLGTAHALKVLAFRDASLVARMLREGQLQGALSHPNVLRVSDLVDVDGSPGLVLDYIAGWTLGKAIGAGLDRAQVDWLAHGILKGAAAAHAAGLIHRDLKPENILLAWHEGQPVPKIADFGLARLLEHPTAQGRLTRGTLGTPGYMAPEQVVDAAGVDHRADVFSLGAVLYELVTGQRAFDGPHAYAVLDRVREGAYTPPREHVPDLPEAWERAICGALEPDLDARLPDVEALAGAWRGSAPEPTPPSAPWPLPEPEDAPPLGASLVGPATHPTLDMLIDEGDRPEIRDHLEGCAPCRVDLRLYRDAFEAEPVLRPAWQLGALAGIAAAPVVLGVTTMVFGPLRQVEEGGPFAFALVLLGVAEAAGLGTLVARRLRGAEDAAWRWIAPGVPPILLGQVGAAVGLTLVARAVQAVAEPEELVVRGFAVALLVSWVGWVLGAVGLLAGAAALARSELAVVQWPRAGAVAVAALVPWVGAVALGVDGAGLFLGWGAAVLAGVCCALPVASRGAGEAALLAIAGSAAAARAVFLGAWRPDPYADVGFLAALLALWPLIVAIAAIPALRTASKRKIAQVVALALPVVALWLWGRAAASAVL